jgi:hypothetical protein
MNTKTKVLIASVASGIIFVGGGLTAQYANAMGPSQPSEIVSMLASKFNLKTSDVQAVFEQYREQNQKTQATKLKVRLEKAVTDKKLTQTQENLILNEKYMISSRMQQINKITDLTQRKKELTQLKLEVRAWAKSNNLKLNWFGLFSHNSK